MIRIHNYLILITLTALLLVAVGCQQEEVSSTEGASKGKIVLNLSPGEVFVNIETRATQTVMDPTGYVFTLSGTDSEGAAVNKTITLQAEGEGLFSSIIEAGDYTLTVENMSQTDAQVGNGQPYYRGEKTFTLEAGTTVELGTIALGSPQNAMVSLATDATFSGLYENPQLTLGNAMVTTSVPGYFMVPESGGTLTFFLSAKGKNHAQEIEGTSISVAVEAGKNTMVTLKAQPINGDWVIIPVVSGTHSGEFDVKTRKP